MLPLAGVPVPAPALQTWTPATWPALWPGQLWPQGMPWRIGAEMTGQSGLFTEVPLCSLATELIYHLSWPQELLERVCQGVSWDPRRDGLWGTWNPGVLRLLHCKQFGLMKTSYFEV